MAMAAMASAAGTIGSAAASNPATMGMIATGIKSGGDFSKGLVQSGMGLAGQRRAIKAQKEMQERSFDFAREMTGRRDAAFTQAGLPTFLGYGVGMAAMPRQTQALHGGNFYTSQIPGNAQSTPYVGSSAQTAFGWGNVQ